VRRLSDVLAAGAVGAAVSGVPSTVITAARGEDVLEGARAAGALLWPRAPLLGAAPVHLALSLAWAAALSAILPERDEPLYGALGGLAIAALDLGVIGRRLQPIAALPQARQWADHVAFGAAVGAVLRARREWRHARDSDHQQGRP
jgi:hypothetical protein